MCHANWSQDRCNKLAAQVCEAHQGPEHIAVVAKALRRTCQANGCGTRASCNYEGTFTVLQAPAPTVTAMVLIPKRLQLHALGQCSHCASVGLKIATTPVPCPAPPWRGVLELVQRVLVHWAQDREDHPGQQAQCACCRAGQAPAFCSRHKLDGMVDTANRK